MLLSLSWLDANKLGTIGVLFKVSESQDVGVHGPELQSGANLML